ncbi:hypothetical protein ACFTWD_00510 [Streptomyces sp. NPDC056943]|uniref:hypothetical protein n=1 Tax=Streptomyces sp. NPDC056943 TaxID=3345971 RepID=UPI00363890F9
MSSSAATTAELSRVTVEPTDGPYDHTPVRAPSHVRDVTDFRVEVSGPLRLAHVALSR